MTKVLVVEDDRNHSRLYELELSEEGYDVVLASNGKEAIRIVEETYLDAVVLDINMPVMDGLDALGRILDARRDLAVIINTAYAHYKDSFMSWSADAYVVKSSDLTELKTCLREALAKRGR